MEKTSLGHLISSLSCGEVFELLSAILGDFNDSAYLCHFCAGPNQMPAGTCEIRVSELL